MNHKIIESPDLDPRQNFKGRKKNEENFPIQAICRLSWRSKVDERKINFNFLWIFELNKLKI